MKVIKPPPELVPFQKVCRSCQATLQIDDVKDLRKKYIPGDFRDPGYTSYFVVCPCCYQEINVEERAIPPQLRSHVQVA